MQKIQYEEVFQALKEDSQVQLSEKELLSILLNAYYMNLSMEELREVLYDYTGDENLSEEIKNNFIKAGGGEAYIRDLCLAINEDNEG